MKKSSASCSDPRVGFFDRQAPTWDQTGPDRGKILARLATMADDLGLRAGVDVLEVGCGTGGLTGWLAERVKPGRVVAIDFSPAMIERAKAKGIAAEFRLADVCRDEVGEAGFDLAFCFHSFPHFRDPGQALRRLGRSLRPGGRLVILHFRSRAEINAFHTQVGGEVASDHLPDDATLAALLAKASLAQIRLVDHEGLFLLEAAKRPAGSQRDKA